MIKCVAVALRKSEKSASSEKVREKARGALWILEDRDQPQNRPKSAKRGLYALRHLPGHLAL